MVLQLTVADVMTKPVLTVRPDTPLQQAVQIISDHHVSGLPVVDAEGRLIGEMTEQDLMVRESGVDAVNAEARSQGLAFPALGYWSPEGHCFVKPAPGDCNGVFKR